MSKQITVMSAMLKGVEAMPIYMEVSITKGMPSMTIFGMPDASAFEVRERVRAAVRGAGFTMPDERVIVNLAPSHLKKSGTGFDLAIAVGILAATGQIARDLAEGTFVGELSFNGSVRAVRGGVAYADLAADGNPVVLSAGETCIDSAERGNRVVGLANLADLRTVGYVSLEKEESAGDFDVLARKLDFADVRGMDMAVRACQVAVAGNLPLLMVGDGILARLLAERLSSIMPSMTEAERREVERVWSCAGDGFPKGWPDVRPTRAPHHSATLPGLVGGGNPVMPGEVTLAHNSVLFLQDVQEFAPNALQAIRQPLEEGVSRIARVDGVAEFPARFMLAAHANPCPCGKFGSPSRDCTCSAAAVERYQGRIAGPLADRFAMRIDVPEHDPLCTAESTRSEGLRAGVENAREFSAWREGKGDSSADARSIVAACRLADDDQAMLEQLTGRCAMGGRQVVGALRIARTIADMVKSERVEREHLAEALTYVNR